MKTITQTLAFLALITTSTYCLANTSFSIKNKLESKVTLTVTGDNSGHLNINNKIVSEYSPIYLSKGSTTQATATHAMGITDITFVLSYSLNNEQKKCTFYIKTSSKHNLKIQDNPPAGCGLDDHLITISNKQTHSSHKQ